MEKDRPAVLDAVNSKHLKMEYNSKTLLYYLPKEEAVQLKVE